MIFLTYHLPGPRISAKANLVKAQANAKAKMDSLWLAKESKNERKKQQEQHEQEELGQNQLSIATPG